MLNNVPHEMEKKLLISKEKLEHLGQLASLFFKLGSLGFGGLPAQISLMESHVVSDRKWLTREKFLDLVGSSNLVPGPNSVEIALEIGYIRAGWLGFVVSGISFILPSAVITIGFAWAYMKFGSLPQVEHFWDGIKPVILAIIIVAIWKLGKTAVKNWRLAVVSIVVLGATLLGINEMSALFLGGFFGMFWLLFYEQLTSPTSTRKINRAKSDKFDFLRTALLLLLIVGSIFLLIDRVSVFIDWLNPNNLSIAKLGMFFLKVGALLYGSGYVLIAFLQGGLVHDYGWLTQKQLFDAIAIGQVTPGPLLSTATFIGYILMGVPGALVATVAIFLPSFLFSAGLHSVMPYFRRFRWTSAFLDAINVSSIALMASVTINLSRSTLISWQGWLIALSTCIIGLRWKVNVSLLIVGGAIIGWILFSL